MALPVVAIVGRPNVGKSSLFNRYAGRRRALVLDTPGITRDRIVEEVTVEGRRVLVVDTAGLDPDAEAGLPAAIQAQARAAVAEADAILFVTDAQSGCLPEDEAIARALRRTSKPVTLAVNKMDRPSHAARMADFYKLGIERTRAVSAEHATGAWDALEELVAALPPAAEAEVARDDTAVRIAIVGRPNVGKSSLVNALVGADRVMVSEIAGTTRDSIDVRLSRGGREYLFVDTAGIRRKGKTTDSAELLSIVASRKAIDRARLVVIVFDASAGITAQDATIAGYAEEAGRGVLLVANKWDLIEKDAARVSGLKEDAKRRFIFLRKAPFLPLSATTGKGVQRLLPEADALAKRFTTRMSTGELNRLLQKSYEREEPRGRSGRNMRIRYAVQVAAEPPLIRLFADRTEPLHFSFERFLQNRIREKWNLNGVPLKFVVKKDD